MLNIEELSMLLMEEQYPILSQEQLELLATMYDNIYQACYVGCTMKAQANKVTVGPISIENDKSFWIQMANSFRQQWLLEGSNKSRSITGKCVGRADE
jgi:hypothetical protein